MNRLGIRGHIRILADELTEAPKGLFTDTQLNGLINLAQESIQMELIEFMPWYFRKEKAISLVSSQREYNISSDLGIDGNIVITTANQKLDFDEGAGEFTATITPGSYTPTTLCAEIKTRMDAAGGAGVHTITYSGKVFRIASTAATFNLRCFTGTNVANGIWTSIGFSTLANKTGYKNYAGDYAIDVQNFLMFESILQQQAGAYSIPLVYLNPTDNFLHETVGQTAAPSSVKYWGYKDVDEIYFVPTPNADAASQLLAYFFQKIADLNEDTDSPGLPRNAHELVALRVLRNWYVRDGDKGAGSILELYNRQLESIAYRFSNPQGPQPGKRMATRDIARTAGGT